MKNEYKEYFTYKASMLKKEIDKLKEFFKSNVTYELIALMCKPIYNVTHIKVYADLVNDNMIYLVETDGDFNDEQSVISCQNNRVYYASKLEILYFFSLVKKYNLYNAAIICPRISISIE